MHQKTQNHFLNFLYICLQESPGKITDKHMENLVRLQNFLGQSFALQLQFTIDIFFRTAVSWKLFDIRFSYKQGNFSRVCLLVKITSKTVTRSIPIQPGIMQTKKHYVDVLPLNSYLLLFIFYSRYCRVLCMTMVLYEDFGLRKLFRVDFISALPRTSQIQRGNH